MRTDARTDEDAGYFAIKMYGRPLAATVSIGEPTRKDTDMKLLCILAAILAISLAETEKKENELSEEAASLELLKMGADLKAEASSYNSYVPPSQTPPAWNTPYYSAPASAWNHPQQSVNNWNTPQRPVNTWNPPQKPVYTWNPPQSTVKPWVPPVQNDVPQYPYPPVQDTWATPTYAPPTTTTSIPVIKNERYYYDNGAYKYEYQIADGTHVGEEGYFTNTKQDDDSLVKRGWYSFVGADGKTYTVKYWADKTGYHAYGDHLPTPPPVPAQIQAALDQQKENEKYKPQQDYYTTQAPQQIYYPSQAPAYVPAKEPAYVPTYYPQQVYYPQHQQTYG